MNTYQMYGTLAVVVLLVTIAAKTRTLWKVGLLFISGWAFTNYINYNFKNPIDGALFTSFYLFASYKCYSIYKAFGCKTTLSILFLFLFSFMFSLHYSVYDQYGYWARGINVLFLFQALLLILASINRMISRRRRHKDIGPAGKERRKRPYIYRIGDMFPKRWAR